MRLCVIQMLHLYSFHQSLAMELIRSSIDRPVFPILNSLLVVQFSELPPIQDSLVVQSSFAPPKQDSLRVAPQSAASG